MPLPTEYEQAWALGRSGGVSPVPGALPSTVGVSPSTGMGFFEGLAKSALSAGTSELIGMDPWQGLDPWRSKHPIASFLSQAAGMAPGYLALGGVSGLGLRALGASSALSKLPTVARLVNYATSPIVGGTNPVVHAAAQEMLRFAPVEAARLGVSAVVGNPSRVFTQGLINIPAAGVMGGLFRGVPALMKGGYPAGGLAAGTGTGNLPFSKAEGEIVRQLPWYQVADPPQIKYRKLMEHTHNTPDMDPELKTAINDYMHGVAGYHGLEGDIIHQTAGRKWAYVKPLEGNSTDARQLNPFFKPGARIGRTVKFLAEGANGFAQADLPVLEKIRKFLPQGWQGFTVTPRAVTLDSDAAANYFRGVVYSMNPIDRNTWLSKEADDGFFVMARKIVGRELPGPPRPGAGRAGDTWLLWKTDQPGMFHPEAATYNAVIRRQLWGRHWEDLRGVSAVAGQPIRPGTPGSEGPLITKYQDPYYNATPVKVTTTLPDGTVESKMVMKRVQDTKIGRYLKSIEDGSPGDSELAVMPPEERLSFLSKMLLKFNPELAQSYGGAYNTAENAIKRVLSPMTTQFEKSPLLLRSLMLTQAALGRAHSLGVDQWVGLRELSSAAPAFLGKPFEKLGLVRRGTPLGATLFSKYKILKPGAKGIYDKMTLDELQTWYHLQGDPRHIDPEWLLKQENIPQRVKDFSVAMSKIDGPNLAEWNTIRQINGQEPLKYTPWHLGWLRRLHDPLKVPIRVAESHEAGGVVFKKGDVLDILDGTNRPNLIKKANETIAFMEKQGIKAEFDPGTIAGADVVGEGGAVGGMNWILEHANKMVPDQQQLLATARVGEIAKPLPGGGKFSILQAPPRTKLEERILGSILNMHSAISKGVLEQRLGYDLVHASRRWPGMTAQAAERIAKLHGAVGPLTKVQNQIADRLLGPFFGHDSATRIVNANNSAMHALTLGFFDVGHAAMNAMTFAQTVMPEASYVLKATDAELATNYAWELVQTGDKLIPIGHMGPWNVVKGAFKDMWSKDKELIEFAGKAIDDGLVAPRMAENVLGEIAEKVGFGTIQGRDQNFSSWVGNLSKYLPAKSEEFSRLNALFVGRRLGMMRGLEGEKLYQFSSQFLRRTMYDYSVGARPQSLTGPLGSFLGLFKTWQFNYLANLKNYSEEALRGNFAPLIWSVVGTGALGGVTAVPGWFMAEAASNLFADKSAMEFLYENTGYKDQSAIGQKAIDTLYFGFPNLIGIALSGRASVPGANVVRDFSMLGTAVSLDRMNTLGKAIGTGWNAFSLTGTHPGNFKLFRDQLVRATMPRSVYRAYQTIGTEGIRSLMTGNQISPGISAVEKLGFSLGLTPTDIQRGYEVMDISTKDQEHYDKTLATYGAMAADAANDGDFVYLNRLVRRAFLDGVMPPALLRSMVARQHKKTSDVAQRQGKAAAQIERKLFGIVHH